MLPGPERPSTRALAHVSTDQTTGTCDTAAPAGRAVVENPHWRCELLKPSKPLEKERKLAVMES